MTPSARGDGAHDVGGFASGEVVGPEFVVVVLRWIQTEGVHDNRQIKRRSVSEDVGKESGGQMGAGESSHREADESRRHAAVLAQAATQQGRRAENFGRGGDAEEHTARLLAALSPYDFFALHDRRWPGTTMANIDHVVAGPSGVYVVDTKDWSGDLRVADGRLYRGETACDDGVDKVRAQADAVREVLADVGLPAAQVRPVIALHGRTFDLQSISGTWVVDSDQLPKYILRRSKGLTQAQVEEVYGALMVALPAAGSPAASPRDTTSAPVAEADASEATGELFSADDLEDAALAAAMQRPFADWMIFLHPAQARFVGRDFAGPARITGGAGTGKTVVALHRLAYLSQGRARRLLYVTFVKTVPLVLSQAFARLSPETTQRVEFASLHSWAARFLRQRRIPCSVDNDCCDRAYADAWAHLAERDLLERSAPFSYWREEVHKVIRGRDLRDLDDYLLLDRVGRGSRLGHLQRRGVWQLATAYADNLRRRDLLDWNDLLRLARDEARRQPPEPAYDAIVLDEAQDMPLLAGQLLVALAGDRPNGLLFVGDDQQRVFPGGFRLVECGVDVSGRSVRFTENYRNTNEVYQTAAALLSGQISSVLEDPGVDETTTSAARSGGQPRLVVAGSSWEHDVALVASLSEWLASRRPSHTVAVLVERVARARHLVAHLWENGIPAVALDEWDGATPDAVIVGTIKRAKGLEFTRVHVAYVEPQVLAPTPKDLADASVEQWQQRRREMYVAMTRARDELWIGVLDPSVSSAKPVLAETGRGVPTAPLSTVHELMGAVLGTVPAGGPERFSQPGWTYEGALVTLTCETCASAMHVCRKPDESAGRAYLYWALTCPQCLTCWAPDQLSDDRVTMLRKLK